MASEVRSFQPCLLSIKDRSVTNVLRTGSLQTKLNAGLSEQQQEDLFQNERSFHEVNSKQHVLDKLTL